MPVSTPCFSLHGGECPRYGSYQLGGKSIATVAKYGVDTTPTRIKITDEDLEGAATLSPRTTNASIPALAVPKSFLNADDSDSEEDYKLPSASPAGLRLDVSRKGIRPRSLIMSDDQNMGDVNTTAEGGSEHEATARVLHLELDETEEELRYKLSAGNTFSATRRVITGGKSVRLMQATGLLVDEDISLDTDMELDNAGSGANKSFDLHRDCAQVSFTALIPADVLVYIRRNPWDVMQCAIREAAREYKRVSSGNHQVTSTVVSLSGNNSPIDEVLGKAHVFEVEPRRETHVNSTPDHGEDQFEKSSISLRKRVRTYSSLPKSGKPSRLSTDDSRAGPKDFSNMARGCDSPSRVATPSYQCGSPYSTETKVDINRIREQSGRPSTNDDLVPFTRPSLVIARSIDHSTVNPTSSIRQIVPYPAPSDILTASYDMYRTNLEAAHAYVLNKKAADPKYHKKPAIPWTVWEDDLVIGHMLSIRLDSSIPPTEARFEECSRRLRDHDNIARAPGAIKNMWNRVGRARSGFDERKSRSNVYATSQQGKKRKLTI